MMATRASFEAATGAGPCPAATAAAGMSPFALAGAAPCAATSDVNAAAPTPARVLVRNVRRSMGPSIESESELSAKHAAGGRREVKNLAALADANGPERIRLNHRFRAVAIRRLDDPARTDRRAALLGPQGAGKANAVPVCRQPLEMRRQGLVS